MIPPPSADPAAFASCADHPSLPAAAGTCQRCGSFMCGGCLSPAQGQRLCLRCYQRVVGSGRSHHLPTLGILTIIHGVLLALAGILYGVTYSGMGFWMSALPPPQGADPAAAQFPIAFMIVIGVVIGLLHIVPGVLQIIAGLKLRKRRGRIFGIVAMSVAMLTGIACYCLPTSIGLLVFGLIVLLDQGVKEVMDRAEVSPDPL